MSANREEHLRDIRERISRLRKELNYADNFTSNLRLKSPLTPQTLSPEEQAKAAERNAEMQALKAQLLGKQSKNRKVA